jgi:hypothetical protein
MPSLENIPEDFSSQDYQYINNLFDLDFSEDYDTTLKKHYLTEGAAKGLKYRVDIPKDFCMLGLLEYNEDLNFLKLDELIGIENCQVNKDEAYLYCLKDSNRYYKVTLPDDFTIVGYKRYNPDLASLPDSYVRKHYFLHGEKEGRVYKLKLPEDFDVYEYIQMNPDLNNLSEGQAEKHYVEHGIREGRKYRDENFDKSFFIKANNLPASVGYLDYLKNPRLINSKFIEDRVAEVAFDKLDLLLVSHESSLYGATHYLYALYCYIKKQYPAIRVKVAEKYKNEELLSKYSLTEQDVFIYHNDMTLLYHICNRVKPTKILINSTNNTAHSIADLLDCREVIYHSHEIMEHYVATIKNKIPDYTVSERISQQWGGSIKIQPPFIDSGSMARLDSADASLVTLSNKFGSLDESKITIGMCGDLSSRKNPELFVQLAKHFKDYNFVWVGGYHSLTEEDIANLYHIQNVKIPYPYFRYLDYFLLTSVIDPCPYVVLENLYLNNRIITFSENIYTDHKCKELENVYFEYPGTISFDTACEALHSYVEKIKTNKSNAGKAYILDKFTQPKQDFLEKLVLA